MRLAPRHVLAAAALFALLAVVATTLAALRAPVLGVDLAADGDVLRVLTVAEDSPNRAWLRPGSRVALVDAPLPAADLLVGEPDELDDWSRLDALFAAMDRLAGADRLAARVDGEPATLVTRPRRSDDLPFRFWMHLAVGGAVFVLAAGVFAFRPTDPAARHFLLLGLGVLVTIYTSAVYGTRELIVDGGLLRAFTVANALGACLVGAALAALMSVYPVRLAARLPALAYTIGGLAGFAQSARLLPAPDTLYLIVLGLFLLGLGLAWPQWRRARDRPVERAALRWYLLSLLLGTGLFAALVAIPQVFGLPPPIDQVWLLPLFLVIPVGIALGILRYRLFELDRWWAGVWFWFFGGVAVMALDLFLLSLFDLTRLGAMAAALALAGWLYFPLRQWLWARWARGKTGADRRAWLRELSAAADPAGLRARWREALRVRYAPLEWLETDAAGPARASVGDDGLALRMADPVTGHGLSLRHAGGGARLFEAADAADADTLGELAGLLLEAMRERDQAVADERQRIRRDLHDDLGAKLLALLYRVGPEDQELVRAAIRDGHDILAALDAEPLDLASAAADWRAEAETRAAGHGFELAWTEHGLDAAAGIELSARQHTNLARILREAISNAVRHAGARHVGVELVVVAGGLELTVTDQGATPTDAPADWRAGGGTRQIAQRAEELGGHADWRGVAGGTRLRVSVPLPGTTPPVPG